MLQRLGAKTLVWTLNLLDQILNFLRISYVKQRGATISSRFAQVSSIFTLASSHQTITTLLSLFLTGASCRMMALRGGTKETFVARKGSLKIGTWSGWSIQPQVFAKCSERTCVWSFSVKFALPVLWIQSFNMAYIFLSGNRAQHEKEACKVSLRALNYTKHCT